VKNENNSRIVRNVVNSMVAVLHGIPEARAEKERAEAACKWLDFLERYYKFLKEVGFSEKEIRGIIGQYTQSGSGNCSPEMVEQAMKTLLP